MACRWHVIYKYIKIHGFNLLFHFKCTKEEADIQKAIFLIKGTWYSIHKQGFRAIKLDPVHYS